MIVVIDYDMGNVSSIVNMLKKIGVESKLSNDADEISKAEKIILPGVGAFDRGMQNLKNKGLIPLIKKHAADKKKPILGICLGMQMLGRGSEEGIKEGLNLISFDNVRFKFDSNTKLKIPHMGWNIISSMNSDNPLLRNIEGIQRYYFVHSYHAVCDNMENVMMTCNYGYDFVAAVKRDNIYGVQFHPEKSHKFGMVLLENFAKRV